MNDNIAQPANKDAAALKWSIITSLVCIILITLVYMFLAEKFMIFFIAYLAVLAVPIVFYGIAAAQQRQLMGGFIEMKEVFRAIFIVIIISTVVINIYNYVYTTVIDPEYIDRVKNGMLSFADKVKMDKKQTDEMLSNFDKQISQQSSIKSRFLGILTQIIVYSIFGFIIAAIVKKKRPVMGQ